jgi:putative membrane protein
MKKRFIPIVSIIYGVLLIYLFMSGKLSSFLAPNMHIYFYLSIVPLIIIGLVTVIKAPKIKFKITDLILLLPIIMLLLAGDGTLTSSFAKSRMNNNNVNKTKTAEKSKTEEKKEEEPTIDKEKYDFSNVYFDVIDSTYQGLSNYLTYTSGARIYSGKTIRVTGFIIKNESYLRDNLVAIGRYGITCCAADAEFAGFMVNIDATKVKENEWYTIEGVLKEDLDGEGYDILSIEVINIKKASKPKDTYVYMCNEYGKGDCSDLQKYEFIY